MAVDSRALHSESIEANRSGRLTDTQRRNLSAYERSNRKSQLSFALLALAIGAIVLFVPGVKSPTVHFLVPFVCVVVAIGLVAWSLLGADPLQRDIRAGTVVSLEGAIGKRTIPLGRSTPGDDSGHFLDVGRESFSVYSGTYDAAPDAGYVRIYYLPRSKHVLNLERIEGGPVAEISSPQDVVRELGAALSFQRVHRNEARAGIQAMTEQLQEQLAQNAQPPPEAARDPRPLARAILGTWRRSMMTVTFYRDGTAEMVLPGSTKSGRWSVDAGGRLHADGVGQSNGTEAWVVGDQLTVVIDGMGMTFTRVSGGSE